MELKIKNNTFYVLEVGNEKRIYDTESGAIEGLKMLVSESKDINPENANISQVVIAKEKWEIKAIPWSKIAMELIRGKKE